MTTHGQDPVPEVLYEQENNCIQRHLESEGENPVAKARLRDCEDSESRNVRSAESGEEVGGSGTSGSPGRRQDSLGTRRGAKGPGQANACERASVNTSCEEGVDLGKEGHLSDIALSDSRYDVEDLCSVDLWKLARSFGSLLAPADDPGKLVL